MSSLTRGADTTEYTVPEFESTVQEHRTTLWRNALAVVLTATERACAGAMPCENVVHGRGSQWGTIAPSRPAAAVNLLSAASPSEDPLLPFPPSRVDHQLLSPCFQSLVRLKLAHLAKCYALQALVRASGRLLQHMRQCTMDDSMDVLFITVEQCNPSSIAGAPSCIVASSTPCFQKQLLHPPSPAREDASHPSTKLLLKRCRRLRAV